VTKWEERLVHKKASFEENYREEVTIVWISKQNVWFSSMYSSCKEELIIEWNIGNFESGWWDGT
jgi:hypothetical protein